ncbi:Archaeal putative transposase ISC1217 [Metallosphaera yellowstonensis MK1]|uniref:Archaeal putative transposase ISC1217 n=1 Tax=Metallosphaera yellowstonensis MK1 TaxID=671065 RepID=H2C893_9CREN|nr:transposase [Metallosphaera yellowstonensis]EHP68369.1 Archaeal putative transposase ISC1217 [Metallosphaera yellowstonensis MK1]
MVLVGGRASVRNAAETFWLDYANLLEALGELDDAWRDYLEVLSDFEGSGRHRGRHSGPRRSGGREPPRTTGSTATPTGGSRGPSSSRSP